MKKIYFDMDGTVYDLYALPNWLELLREEREGAFTLGSPKVDMVALREVCELLRAEGWDFGIITWLPIGATKKYCRSCEQEKKEWAKKFMPYITEFYTQVYGVPKQIAPIRQAKTMILIDDNAGVRKTWETKKQRKTIDANLDIIAELRKLLR